MPWEYAVTEGVSTRAVSEDLLWDDLLRTEDGNEDELPQAIAQSQVDHQLKFRELAAYIYEYDLEGKMPDIDASSLGGRGIIAIMEKLVYDDLVRHMASEILPALLKQRADEYIWCHACHKWLDVTNSSLVINCDGCGDIDCVKHHVPNGIVTRENDDVLCDYCAAKAAAE